MHTNAMTCVATGLANFGHFCKSLSHPVLALQCEAGMTPNPDLACNRHIKFGALLDHCKALGADMVATGHYARIAQCGQSGQLQLLRGADPLKDQSYFLASVRGESLAGDPW